VDAAAVTSLFNVTKELTADDWIADPADVTGVQQPTLSLAFTLQNGQTKRMAFGNAPGTDDHRYASLQEAPGTFVIAAATYKSITEALEKLLSSPPAAASTESEKQ
jgi:hypothetical protein